ncbi:hypothetical protein [Streptomyces albiaxialis]|uniref:hypothetical protein n=1 Tax=Streptomyces albiaxialis TaxID=329523 RepID=UPI0031E196AB
MAVSGADWEPPPCWYAPTYTPKQLKKAVDESPYELTGKRPDNGAKKQEIDGSIREKYSKGDYKNFNLKKQGDGMFWAAVPNPNEKDAAKRESCTELPFWVKKGEQPDVPGAIDTKILAALAYQRIQVPETKVELNPENKQTVRLPTWAWLDKGTFKPLSVTASIDLGGGVELSATTTVEPGALKLEPGTEDAETHPASGECAAGEDGTIGTPYTKGNAKKTPPCGMTYLRSTPKGETYAMKASVVWNAEWKGTDGTGDKLPDGVFGNEQPVPVQEVQSVNRD